MDEASQEPFAPAIRAAVEELAARMHTDDEPIEVLRVESRVILRRGTRVFAYLVGPDGRARLDPSGEKDGGRFMVRPPRFDT